MKKRSLIISVLGVPAVGLSLFWAAAPAFAESRWDGLQTSPFDTNFFGFQTTTEPQDPLQERGIETDFSAEPTFEPEFRIETFSDRFSKPFTSGGRER